MEEFDLKNLFQKWWIIVSFGVITLILGIVYTFFYVKPIYQSETTVYIGKSTVSESIAISYTDVLLNDRLVNDYRELVKSRLIADTVIKEMNLKNITYNQLKAKLSVTSKKDTRIIVITSSDSDPEFAKNLVDKVAEVFQKKAVEIMKVENIQVIDRAMVPNAPAKPNKLIYLAISFFVGLLAGTIVVVLYEFFDSTIKTPNDVIKYLDISVIGTIPVLPN